MDNITGWGFPFRFSDPSVNGSSSPAQLASVPAIPGTTGRPADFSNFDPADVDSSFDPLGGFTAFGGNQLSGDTATNSDVDANTDFEMGFGAMNQIDPTSSSDAADIGFDTNTGANGDMPGVGEANNFGTTSGGTPSMRSLLANFMKRFQSDNPNLDGGNINGVDTGTVNNGTGDINYGGSDLGSDAPYAPVQSAANPGSTTTNKARTGVAGTVAPGPTYVDQDPALLAEIAQREKTDPAGAAKLRQLAHQPVAHWLNGTPYDAQHLKEYLDNAQAAGKEGSVSFYNIPGRDNGGFSGGGAKSVGEYKAWAKQMSDVIGNRKTTVYLETDAIMQTRDMSPAKADERLKLIGDTVTMLKKNNPNATVVLNAGSAGWGSPAGTAALLKRANVQNADGFFLNVAGFESTPDSMRHGDAIVSELAKQGITGKRYIIDTSRNGAHIKARAGTPEAWADPDGAASGTAPTTDQAIIKNPNVMALSWVKTPWNGDGRVTQAGAMAADYAIKLVQNSGQ